MRMTMKAGFALVAVMLLTAGLLSETERPTTQEAAEPAVVKRPAWATSRIKGSPEPPLPYVAERAFANLQFKFCVDLVTAPGSDRLFLVEQYGKIFSFPNKDDVQNADLVVDLAKEIPGVMQVYALAFHPRFEQNRFCYVCYIKDAEQPDGSHVARFQMRDTDPPTIDPASETTLVTWLSGGHNGCCLKFGPDGCLYISTGDAGPANPPDPLHAGQDLSNLLSSILRIDVDQTQPGMNYRIPDDNPFVTVAGARGEIWAYGLRNPWRMSFDAQTGDLWVGDVGWELWEMLYRIERGGNYGWAVMEGSHPVNPEWERGPTPFLLPAIEHPHSESSSITDGLTYYGSRLKDLYGTHIYSDYDTGKFWAFRFTNGKVAEHREIADTTHRVVGFGEDHAGEFYFLDHVAGTIHRLVPNPEPDLSAQFPRRLSETGIFDSVEKQTPAAGVVAYEINASPWADHADANRHIAIPGESAIQSEGPAWKFPPDSVLVKTLSLEMEQDKPETRRLIETQVLHYDGINWNPYTYRWNDEQTDATLVDANGAEQTFEITDAHAPGGVRRQTWRFAGRAECQRCHNSWSGPPLAFNTPQLNTQIEVGDAVVSQLDHFSAIGLFATAIPTDNRPALADPHDPLADLNDRARAYLHANCAHCHRLHAGGAVLSHMHFDLPIQKTNMLDARPSQGTFGIYDAKVIAPGDPFRSVLWYRLTKLGSGRMPYIGSTEVDAAGVELIFQWIKQLKEEEATNSTLHSSEKELKSLKDASQTNHQADVVDKLLSQTADALMLMRAVDEGELPDAAVSVVLEKAKTHDQATIRDLFERFLPAGERVQRLGTAIEPDRILALPGDAQRGKQVFFSTAGVACKSCHRIGQEGTDIGPDLSTIGNKYSQAELLESILQPSKRIDAKYLTYLAETADGRVLSGLLVSKDDQQVVLRDASNMLHHLPATEVEQLVVRKESLMPELLLRDMTAQQVADLLAYLSSLK